MNVALKSFSKSFALCVLVLCIAGCNSGDSGGGGSSVSTSDSGNGAADTTDSSTTAEGDSATTGEAEAAVKEGWGHLKGRFTMVGAPQPAKIEITKDAAYCGKFTIVDRSLVVNANGGLANVVVMLNLKRSDTPPEPHESYAATASANVILDNIKCEFQPRVVLLRSSQTLEVKNSDPDPVAHNTKIEADPPINPILPPGGTVTAQFKAGRLPAPVSCSIHPWMSAKLVVKDTPYMAVTNDNGEFVIENLPSGNWEFQVWQERLGYVSKVNIGGKDAEWSRGQVEVTINGDETTDLGEVKLDYAKYK
jgi:hypothetical protein